MGDARDGDRDAAMSACHLNQVKTDIAAAPNGIARSDLSGVMKNCGTRPLDAVDVSNAALSTLRARCAMTSRMTAISLAVTRMRRASVVRLPGDASGIGSALTATSQVCVA